MGYFWIKGLPIHGWFWGLPQQTTRMPRLRSLRQNWDSCGTIPLSCEFNLRCIQDTSNEHVNSFAAKFIQKTRSTFLRQLQNMSHITFTFDTQRATPEIERATPPETTSLKSALPEMLIFVGIKKLPKLFLVVDFRI